MYRFYVNSLINDKHYGDMLRVFFAESDFEVITIDLPEGKELSLGESSYLVNKSKSTDRNTIKTELYHLGRELTGITPEWGILTGVRPLKLAYDVFEQYGSIEAFKDRMKSYYLVSEEKIQLLTEIMNYQNENIEPADERAALYIHIPFCPTKCTYCSFASEECSDSAVIDDYLDHLCTEIEYTAKLCKENNLEFESGYVGGGTPTTLNEKQLERLLDSIRTNMGIDTEAMEFTFEAGRPDTIDAAKLEALRSRNISRISINPQTMFDRTLKSIGRNHTSKQIVETYELAREYGFDCINADLIAGLKDETPEEFHYSLEQMVKLGADNITVHTLSVKRGSKLKDQDPDFYRKDTHRVDLMLSDAHDYLLSKGYYPYYIYRQKHQMGSLENVGYCLKGKHSLYNIRIMEEKQTIVAMGAGGIGKVYNPEDQSLTRIPNVGNYKVYIERIDEMLERKKNYFL